MPIKLKIVHFFFRKSTSFYSIEELFLEIQQQLNNRQVPTASIISKYPSTGIINRIRIILQALNNTGNVNHITGDIHFLGIFLPRKNTVLTIHDCGELQKHKGLKRFFLWLFWFYLPVKRLKFITTVSHETKQELLRYVKTNPDKIRVIYNCLIGEYFIKQKEFNSVWPRILQVGITENKNLTRVISALTGLNCTLIILGQPGVDDLSNLSNSGIKYELHNNLSRREVQSLYSSSDLLVFTSLIEGFGLPIIEAQATGIPVITSNLSSMPEIAGDGACFVDPHDVKQIQNGILEVINNKSYRDRLIINGLGNCRRFSPEHIADEYFNLYRNIQKNL